MGARHLGIGFESTVNTPVTPTVFLHVLRFTPRIQKNYEQPELLGFYSSPEPTELPSEIGFDVEFLFDYQTIGYLLYWFLGIAPDTTGAGPYTHTFPPSGGLAADGREGVAVTAQARLDDALALDFAGCKCTALALTASKQGAARVSISCVAQSVAKQGSPATASYLDRDWMKPGRIDLQFDGTSIKPRDLSLNYAWGIDDDNHDLTSLDPAEEYGDSGILSLAGSSTSRFNAFTQYDKLVAGTDVDLTALLTSAGDEALTINVNKSRLTDATPPVDGKKRLVTNYQFFAYRDAAATEISQFVLVNDVVAIPA